MNIQDKIMRALKQHGRVPTARLAAIVGLDYHKFLKLAQKMWEDKLVVCEIETQATYWRLP